MPQKYWTKTVFISSWEIWSFPSLSLIEEIVLWALLAMVDLWKNLVLRSPSFSHWTPDFFLQKISSCLHKFSHSWWFLSTCSLFTLSRTFAIRAWLSSYILISTYFFPTKMLPKSFLFQSLNVTLMCFNLLCKRNILVPWIRESFDHHFSMLLMNSEWESQIFSNLKALFLGAPMPLISSWTGQWSQTPKGRTLTIISLSISIRSYEVMNLSNLEATWTSRDLLLFQVKRPLFVLVSKRHEDFRYHL